MPKYEVVGNHAVAGVKPGGVVELDAEQARHLQRGGHVKPVPEKPKPSKVERGDV